MKYIVAIGDGMSDRPVAALGGRTPLEAASIPNMDELARLGRCGRLITIPDGFIAGSEVANLSILGYDLRTCFEGRGVLEAASMGVELPEGSIAMRCNLIAVQAGRIHNHSAGHISTEEAREIIGFLNERLSGDTVRFHPGVSYRHVLVVKGGSPSIECTPPHDVPGEPVADHLVRATAPDGEATADLLNRLIDRSREILAGHPVNARRRERGLDMANSIWPWSPGRRPRMETMPEKYGLRGAVISAVDLLRGIAVYAGMDVIKVEGATGLPDTNYEGKADAALEALEDRDFVYVHVEGIDEAGHEGNTALKIRAIEDFDRRLIGRIREGISRRSEEVSIAVLPDHATPVEVRTHVREPVPFLIWRPGTEPDPVDRFDEASVGAGAFGTIEGEAFMHALLGRTGK